MSKTEFDLERLKARSDSLSKEACDRIEDLEKSFDDLNGLWLETSKECSTLERENAKLRAALLRTWKFSADVSTGCGVCGVVTSAGAEPKHQPGCIVHDLIEAKTND